jgi:MFS family permease
MSSWLARIPQVRDSLRLDPSELGLVLLSLAAGSVIALPLSGPLIARVGPRRTVAVGAVLASLAAAALGLGYHLGAPVTAAALFVFGASGASWDVAMNVHGAAVERALGRSVMSRFHAVFSLGTVGGALIGAGAVALGVSVTVHLVVVAVVLGVTTVAATAHFLPDAGTDASTDASTDVRADVRADASTDVHPASPGSDRSDGLPPRGAFAAWREPRTLLVGLFVLAFAFAEGVGNDWIAVAVIDGHGVPHAVGALAFATFLAAMTTARWLGPQLLARYGRVRLVRWLTGLAVAGTLLFALAPNPGVAFAGTVLWGLGASLGFPMGMSAAADDPAVAAGRVSAVSSIGYCAFLAGPPLIGFLGDAVTVPRAVLAVAGPLLVAVVIAPALRAPSS